MPSVGEKRKCPDCGSNNLVLQKYQKVRNVRLKDFPVTKCIECGNVSLSDIGIEVYTHFNNVYMGGDSAEYEEACAIALKEPVKLDQKIEWLQMLKPNVSWSPNASNSGIFTRR